MKENKIPYVSLNSLLTFLGALLLILSFLLNNYYIDSQKNIKKELPSINAKKEVKKQKQINQGDRKNKIIKPLAVDKRFSAKSYLVYDLKSNEIVGGINVNKKMPIASLTKLATAIVSMNYYSLDSPLTVPESCQNLEGSKVGIKPKESFYVEDLLYGLLLRSASDAACTLYTNYPGGEKAFIKEMNILAKSLKMENTNFTNAIGLDTPSNYSTATDLLKLVKFYRNIEKLKIISGTRDYTLKSINNNSAYYILNTNELLHQIPGTIGYKTGYTENAGECLIYGYNNQGNSLIIIVLGSRNRFYDVKNLLNLYLEKVSSPKVSQ